MRKFRDHNGRHKRTILAKTPRSKWVCHYCGASLSKETATLDHVKPLSAGGYDKRKNKVLSCAPCNNAKGSMAYGTFVQARRAAQREREGG